MPLPYAAAGRQDNKLFVTPIIDDILFSEIEDKTRGEFPEYGTPHYDSNKWPNHKLVFIKPVDNERDEIYEFFYAADRENQDAYNWNMTAGEELIRTYFIPREDYYARTDAEAAAANPVIPTEFTRPVVATPDIRFPRFGFADDTLDDAPAELRSRYVVIRRRFVEPITNEILYSPQLEHNILVTKEIIPAYHGNEVPVAALEVGKTTEVRQGNVFHDVKITQEIQFSPEELIEFNANGFIELEPVPAYVDYRLPSKLDSINIAYAWAWANSDTAPQSYSEDFYFEWKITDPRQGPYSATIRRFLTAEPELLKVDFPLYRIPSPRRETIGVVYSWWHSSNKGNSTQAVAREVEIPATIHDEIPITFGGIQISGSSYERRSVLSTNKIEATPNFSNFITQAAGTGGLPITIGYDTNKQPLGLYEVRITEIDISSLYSAYSANSFTGIVGSPPTGETDTHTLTVEAGHNIHLQFGSPESGATYQWFVNGEQLIDGVGISGATTTILDVLDAQYVDIGQYSLVRTLDAEEEVVYWINVNVVGGVPNITLQPASQTLPVGEIPNLLHIAADRSVTYQWYLGLSGDITNPIPTEMSNNYFPVQYFVPNTSNYWCRVNAGGITANSNTAIIMFV